MYKYLLQSEFSSYIKIYLSYICLGDNEYQELGML